VPDAFAPAPTARTEGNVKRIIPLVVLVCALAAVSTAAALHPTPDPHPLSLERYRSVIHNQLNWTNRALTNRCRDRVTLDEFTKTPVAAVLPKGRPPHVFYATRRHHKAQARSSACVPTDPRALGRYLAARLYGWTGAAFDAIDGVIRQESGWDPCAHFPGVHGDCGYTGDAACGVPQAVPCSKLRNTWCGVSTLGACSANLQIRWLLRYIDQRYGSPAAFAAHKWKYGWV
jgi:hypothetical protein